VSERLGEDGHTIERPSELSLHVERRLATGNGPMCRTPIYFSLLQETNRFAAVGTARTEISISIQQDTQAGRDRDFRVHFGL